MPNHPREEFDSGCRVDHDQRQWFENRRAEEDFFDELIKWMRTTETPNPSSMTHGTSSLSWTFTTTEYGAVWSNSEALVGSLQFGMVVRGKYEYIDVIFEGEDRVLIDVDFRSQFEIARSTKKYCSLLQMLPPIFVGRPDHIRQIIAVMCEAGKQSLKKKGLHIPPWRKLEYTRSTWVAPHRHLPPSARRIICSIWLEMEPNILLWPEFTDRHLPLLPQISDEVKSSYRRFPVNRYSGKEIECCFCLCDVQEGDEFRRVRCNHVFHKDCLDRWVDHGRPGCPLCRESLTTAAVVPSVDVSAARLVCTVGIHGNGRWPT